MPRSRVSAILAGKRAISVDTALRFAAYFRMEPEAWLELQLAWDLARATPVEGIEPLDPPGFLLGPLGATRLPARGKTPTAKVRYTDARSISERGGGPMTASEGGTEVADTASHREVQYPNGTRALVSRRR